MAHLGKRDRTEFEKDLRRPSRTKHQFGVGKTLSLFNGDADDVNPPRDARTTAETGGGESPKSEPGLDWQVASGRKKQKSKSHENGKHEHPEIAFSTQKRLQTQVRIEDLQALVLYLLSDGPSPQWIAVKNHQAIRKVVAVMVWGLDRDVFFSDMLEKLENAPSDGVDANTDTAGGHSYGETSKGKPVSPDDYCPTRLEKEYLPRPLQPMADMFTHLWPIKAPGDSRMNRLYSPLQAMLLVPLQKSRDGKDHDSGPRPPREAKSWDDKPTPITAFVGTTDELRDSEYTLHPALLSTETEKQDELQKRKAAGQTSADGWLDSDIPVLTADLKTPHEKPKRGDLTAGYTVLAIDCEMVLDTNDTFALARISVVDWTGAVILDSLVKPTQPIKDYLTPFSGMTAEKLDPVTTTLADIQTRLLPLLTLTTILVGHSLNSDLTALKLTHPFIVDTSILYPHPRGPPLKSSLKFLAQKYLSRDIQSGRGGKPSTTTGHDSIEDARAALDLVKLKCQRGPDWGTPDATKETIFKRISRCPKPRQAGAEPTGTAGGSAVIASDSTTTTAAPQSNCTTAIVDWGSPQRGYGSAADVRIGCSNDAEVVAGVQRAVNGDSDDATVPNGGVDFVWARLRELERARGWWTPASSKGTVNETQHADGAGAASNGGGQRSHKNVHNDTNAHEDANDSTTSAVSNGPREPATGPIHATARDTTPENGPATTKAPATAPTTPTTTPTPLSTALATTTASLLAIHASLPPGTAFIVYSGGGDARAYTALTAQQAAYRHEYATKKWDEMGVRWGGEEEARLREAFWAARMGVGFVVVK